MERYGSFGAQDCKGIVEEFRSRAGGKNWKMAVNLKGGKNSLTRLMKSAIAARPNDRSGDAPDLRQ